VEIKLAFLRGLRFALFGVIVLTAAGSFAQTARQLITSPIDERKTVALPGNTRPEATAQNDRGRVDDSLVLDHMQLLLKRPVEREAALTRYLDDLHNPKSADFHRWLTPAQFRSDYGPADADINTVTDWLGKHGFTVNVAQSGGLTIDFSGTAGQVREAFKTEIHYVEAGANVHLANMTNPQIPAALAGAVTGIVALHDFRPHTNYEPRSSYTFKSGSVTYHALVPADLATIYNLNPLFSAGVSGQGQTIVVIEDTDIYSASDWTAFRSTFGLSGYTSGSLTQAHPAPPTGTNNCSNPGVVSGNEMEAELDAEWASAAAPSAAIIVASCKDSRTTFGGLIALQNLIDASGTPPAIVSISYGECEAENGATANAAYYAAYQQAAAEGVSVFVSSGDEGAASCDADLSNATHGIGVSGLASTPYNVAVGGTDFADSYLGTTASYWSASNTATYGSALSYIPEIPWNDSCASRLIATVEGYATSYGSAGFCNSSTGRSFLTTASGSGGPSGCASGAPSTSGVVSGTCAGYGKPSWQALAGVPADNVRDLPDVSLFAANGVWGHYYLFCDSDRRDGGAACTGAPSAWTGAGGTSFASPIWAGFQALVNQKEGRQGNPNPVYYALAASEYGVSGSAACNSNGASGVASNCIFNDVTLGDMDVNCTGKNNCYLPSGTYGVLSTSDSGNLAAYGTQVGWDFATGIGTVNVTNLVNGWATAP
jgi:subtilase family serine protease